MGKECDLLLPTFRILVQSSIRLLWNEKYLKMDTTILTETERKGKSTEEKMGLSTYIVTFQKDNDKGKSQCYITFSPSSTYICRTRRKLVSRLYF